MEIWTIFFSILLILILILILVFVLQVPFMLLDQYGNTHNCTLTVKIFDEEEPEFEYCPESITESTEINTCSKKIHWTRPQARDNDPEGVTVRTRSPPSNQY